MSKFKIGDIVRAKSSYEQFCKQYNDVPIYEVCEGAEDSEHFIGRNIISNHKSWLWDDNFDLVDSQKITLEFLRVENTMYGFSKNNKEKESYIEVKSNDRMNLSFKEMIYLAACKLLNNRQFIPHLVDNDGSVLGYMGYPTLMKDKHGTRLRVGDVVCLLSNHALYKDLGFRFVVSERNIDTGLDQAYIMGIKDCCNEEGEINGFQVIKVFGYDEILNDTTFGDVTAKYY